MASITGLNNWLFEFNLRHKPEPCRASYELIQDAQTHVLVQLKRLSTDTHSLISLTHLKGNVLYLSKPRTTNEQLKLINELFAAQAFSTCHNPDEEIGFWNIFSLILNGIPRKKWTQEIFDQLTTFCVGLHHTNNGKINALARLSQLFAMPIDKKQARSRWEAFAHNLLPVYNFLTDDLAKHLMTRVEFHHLQPDDFKYLHTLGSLHKDRQNLIVHLFNHFFPKLSPGEEWEVIRALCTSHQAVYDLWNQLTPEQQSLFNKTITRDPIDSVQKLIARLDCYRTF